MQSPNLIEGWLGGKTALVGKLLQSVELRWCCSSEAAMNELSERGAELKRRFSEYLEHRYAEFGEDEKDDIKLMLTKENIQKNKLRLQVDLHDLHQYDAKMVTDLLNEPSECIQPFEEALDDYIKRVYEKTLQVTLLPGQPLANSSH